MSKKGYTLIEILVAMSVMAILFSLGYVGYRDFSRRQTLQGTAKTLQGNLRKAQQNALSGIKPDDVSCNNLDLVGYNFYVVNSSEYQIQANCSGVDVVTDDITLPENITISVPSPNPIIFKVLGLGTNITDESTTVTLNQNAGSDIVNSANITIGSGGDIN